MKQAHWMLMSVSRSTSVVQTELNWNNYWMDCHKFWSTYQWIPKNEAYWLKNCGSEFSSSTTIWLLFVVNCLNNYCMDWHTVWSRHWWSLTFPFSVIKSSTYSLILGNISTSPRWTDFDTKWYPNDFSEALTSLWFIYSICGLDWNV